MAFIGVAAFTSAFLLAYCGVFVCLLLLGIALPHRPGAELQVSGLFLQFMCAPLHVLVVLLCVVVGASLVFWSFLVFFLPPSPPFISLCLLLCITMVVYCLFYFFFSTELLALCDGCLGWGWVWQAGLVAGLRDQKKLPKYCCRHCGTFGNRK